MNRLSIACLSLMTLTLVVSSGCKKEQPETTSVPEKVSAPEAAAPQAGIAEAYSTTPPDRALKTQSTSKTAASGRIKRPLSRASSAKPNSKSATTAIGSQTVAQDAVRPGGAPPERARTRQRDIQQDDEYDSPQQDPPRDRSERKDQNDPTRAAPSSPTSRYRNDRRTPKAVSGRTEPARAAGLPTRVRPNAEQLLRKEDLTELLKLKKTVDVHELPGIAADHEYDGIYWGSPDGSSYYVGLQLWKMRSPIEAQRQYTQMVRSYPNAEETTAVTSKTFLAFWNDFIYLIYLDTTKQSVVAITCHEKVCTQPSMLVGIAQKSRDRL